MNSKPTLQKDRKHLKGSFLYSHSKTSNHDGKTSERANITSIMKTNKAREGFYQIDMDGNRYLDCCNNVARVGHSEPRVVQAGVDALKQIQTNGRFLHPTQDR